MSLRESRTLLIFKVIGQGNRFKFLGEGIRHALRCPCYYLLLSLFTRQYFLSKFEQFL